MNETDMYSELLLTENRIHHDDTSELGQVTDYIHLVRNESWQQIWDPDARSVGEAHTVTGSIWSNAIERCLMENGSALIPRFDEPIYIDRPIVLHSGNHLAVHPQTEVRLVVGASGTCMVRNASIVSSQEHPVNPCAGADAGIVIEGGIWSDQRNEGRGRGGAYDQAGTMPGSRGTFVLHNVSGIHIRNVIFRDCSAFAIQLGNAAGFIIEEITFDETADGIHIEGPAACGIIRHIAGKTDDDLVALNAWDWDDSSLTFGPIRDVLVEDVEAQPGYVWSELRLLPGTKVFPSGEIVTCDISRCIYHNIRGVHTIKMYDQPNLSKPEQDFADPIGRMSDLFFSDIVVDGISREEYYDKSSDSVFDICADIDTLSIRNVHINYTPGEGEMAPYLVSVGPKALTWPRGRTIEEGFKEVFNPNANPVVRDLTIIDVYTSDPEKLGAYVLCHDTRQLVHARCLALNQDFPHTMPRGGTGCGSIVDPILD